MTTTETTELGFNVDIAVPKRPDKWSKEVQEVAAIKVAELLKDYWKSDGGIDDKEALWCAEEIIDNNDYDGYKLAKFCDYQWNWDVDSELVDALNNTHSIVYKASDSAQREWVKEYNITVPYEVGQRVHFKLGKESKTGEIKSIWDETAKLTIRNDEGYNNSSTTGNVVPVEDVLSII
jgi:hypothetical protein